MILRCPKCRHDMQAPDTALGKRVLCPICQGSFTASLPVAAVMEDLPVPELEPPPPGFADYPSRQGGPPGSPGSPPPRIAARPGDLIARPIDEHPQPPRLPKAPTPPDEPERPMEIVDILQGRNDVPDLMADALAALGGGTGSRDVEYDDDEDEDDDRVDLNRSAAEALGASYDDPDDSDPLADLASAGQADQASKAARPRFNPANQWYILTETVEYGPYSGQAILAAVRAGKLGPQLLLHDGTADVELTVAQLRQAMQKQGPPRTPPKPATTPTRVPPAVPLVIPPDYEPPPPPADPLAETHTMPTATPSALASPPSDGPDAVDALADLVGGREEEASPPAPAAPTPAGQAPARDDDETRPAPATMAALVFPAAAATAPRRRGIGLSDAALALTAVVLLPVAVSLLLPWLASQVGAGLPDIPNRLNELAKPWAFSLAGLTFGALVLAVTLLGGRRWHGRRALVACLVVMCLGILVVEGLALHHIKSRYAILIRPGSLGIGAWFALLGAAGALVLAALAAASMTSARTPRR